MCVCVLIEIGCKQTSKNGNMEVPVFLFSVLILSVVVVAYGVDSLPLAPRGQPYYGEGKRSRQLQVVTAKPSLPYQE